MSSRFSFITLKMEFHQPPKLPPLKSISTAEESQHEQNVSVFKFKKNKSNSNE